MSQDLPLTGHSTNLVGLPTGLIASCAFDAGQVVGWLDVVDVDPIIFFTAPPPRFHFRPSEQALLRLALRNLSDEEAHQELGVTLHTVKRLWKDIFQRVEDLVPGWLPSQGYTGHRGAEKRRHLLDYLVHHLEELRPRLRPIKELR